MGDQKLPQDIFICCELPKSPCKCFSFVFEDQIHHVAIFSTTLTHSTGLSFGWLDHQRIRPRFHLVDPTIKAFNWDFIWSTRPLKHSTGFSFGQPDHQSIQLITHWDNLTSGWSTCLLFWLNWLFSSILQELKLVEEDQDFYLFIYLFHISICFGEIDGPYAYLLRIKWYHRRFSKYLEEASMGKYLNKEKLEELRDFNRKIQEEIQYGRKRTDGLEKDLAKLQDSFWSGLFLTRNESGDIIRKCTEISWILNNIT